MPRSEESLVGEVTYPASNAEPWCEGADEGLDALEVPLTSLVELAQEVVFLAPPTEALSYWPPREAAEWEDWCAPEPVDIVLVLCLKE